VTDGSTDCKCTQDSTNNNYWTPESATPSLFSKCECLNLATPGYTYREKSGTGSTATCQCVLHATSSGAACTCYAATDGSDVWTGVNGACTCSASLKRVTSGAAGAS